MLLAWSSNLLSKMLEMNIHYFIFENLLCLYKFPCNRFCIYFPTKVKFSYQVKPFYHEGGVYIHIKPHVKILFSYPLESQAKHIKFLFLTCEE